MRILSFLFVIFLVLIGITFATLNSDIVTFDYYIGRSELPLSLLIVLVFCLGALLGMLVGAWLVVSTKLQAYRIRQRLKLAEKEIENLRAIPIRDQH